MSELAVHFFLLFSIGILCGAIDWYSHKITVILWLGLILLLIFSFVRHPAETSNSFSGDWFIEFVVGVVGFTTGFSSGRIGMDYGFGQDESDNIIIRL